MAAKPKMQLKIRKNIINSYRIGYFLTEHGILSADWLTASIRWWKFKSCRMFTVRGNVSLNEILWWYGGTLKVLIRGFGLHAGKRKVHSRKVYVLSSCLAINKNKYLYLNVACFFKLMVVTIKRCIRTLRFLGVRSRRESNIFIHIFSIKVNIMCKLFNLTLLCRPLSKFSVASLINIVNQCSLIHVISAKSMLKYKHSSIYLDTTSVYFSSRKIERKQEITIYVRF